MIKKILKKIIFKEKATSETYVGFLKEKGVAVGKNCRIFDPVNTSIDLQNPKIITIGDDVKITSGVKILTHDYSWSVLSVKYEEMFGNVGPITIGNNVFIGVNSVILKNTKIGDNVIIGAGSIVNGNIEGNSVYAGNPAKKIISLEKFYDKIKDRQEDDIKTIIEIISKRNMSIDEQDLFEYFYKFTPIDKIDYCQMQQINHIGKKEKILEKYKNEYNTFEELLYSFGKSEKNE